jgi:hypothetical protein
MEESYIRFPITCPRCGNESLTEFRAVVATIAVVEWDASDTELDQIGAYLGASWIGASPSRTISRERARPAATSETDRTTAKQCWTRESLVTAGGLRPLSRTRA